MFFQILFINIHPILSSTSCAFTAFRYFLIICQLFPDFVCNILAKFINFFNYPYYKMKTLDEIKKILKDLKPELKKKYSVKEIGIFGSVVRNKQKRRSDIDIAVEFNTVPDLITFIDIETFLEKKLGRKVDLVRKKSIRPELKEIILNEMVAV